MYAARQRFITESLLLNCEVLSSCKSVLRAIRWAILCSTEVAGLLARWDRFYLKTHSSMAGHRFNFTTLPAEPCLWDPLAMDHGTVARRFHAFKRASLFFEKALPSAVRVESEANRTREPIPCEINVRVVSGSSATMALPSECVDLVLTDPPYHNDVYYSDVSAPLRSWAGLSNQVMIGEAIFLPRAKSDIQRLGTSLDQQFSEVLSRVFRESKRVLRLDGKLILTLQIGI